MANWKKVDADQLDADLTSVADAIRERAGISEKLDFPSEYKSAVEGIPDLLEMRVSDTLVEYSNHRIDRIKSSAFAGCAALVHIDTPAVIVLEGYAFQNCSKLTKIDLPIASYIADFAFANCSKLRQFITRRSDKITTLQSVGVFNNTPIKSGTGYIYVPRAWLSDTDATKDYRRATNWSTYANQFRALEDYTVDGTVNGALDETKI